MVGGCKIFVFPNPLTKLTKYECGDLNTLTRGGDLLFLSMLESYGFPELLDLISYKYVPWK